MNHLEHPARPDPVAAKRLRDRGLARLGTLSRLSVLAACGLAGAFTYVARKELPGVHQHSATVPVTGSSAASNGTGPSTGTAQQPQAQQPAAPAQPPVASQTPSVVSGGS